MDPSVGFINKRFKKLRNEQKQYEIIHAPPSSHHPLAAKQEPYKKQKKSLSLNEKILHIFRGEKSGEWASRKERERERGSEGEREGGRERESNDSRQKERRGEIKVELNHSLEIPDGGGGGGGEGEGETPDREREADRQRQIEGQTSPNYTKTLK